MEGARSRTKTHSISLKNTNEPDDEEPQNLLLERQPNKAAASNGDKDPKGLNSKDPYKYISFGACLLLLGCVVLASANRGITGISVITFAPQVTKDPSTSSVAETLQLGSLLRQRVEPLDRTQFFSFVHIPKTGGAQWWRLIFRALVTYQTPLERPQNLVHENRWLFPYRPAGAAVELPLLYTVASAPNANYTLISLRSPLHHVFSQYSHCRYFKGKNHIIRTKHLIKMFNENNISMSRDEGFEKWLSLFIVESDSNATVTNNELSIGAALSPYRVVESYDSYGCYNPINVQSRFLTSSNKTNENLFLLEPEPKESIGNLRRYTDFVGILDFYHESKCLFYHRVLLSPQTNSSDSEVQGIQEYLDKRCLCPWPEAVFDEKKVEHHKDGKRSTMVDLNSTIKEMVATVAGKDMIMYKSALMDFFHEIMWLESPAQLNRRVMCDESLQKQELELAYLGLNVSSLYAHAKAKGAM